VRQDLSYFQYQLDLVLGRAAARRLPDGSGHGQRRPRHSRRISARQIHQMANP
jgi:hypothetical protein